MALLIGVLLALAVSGFATLFRLDRDRAFYPTVMIVVASYYALYAVIGGTTAVLIAECGVIAVFVAAAVAGFKYSPWVVVAALAAHGIFDSVHGHLIANPGVPLWWPMFCLGYDVVAAAYLALILLRRPAAAPTS